MHHIALNQGGADKVQPNKVLHSRGRRRGSMFICARLSHKHAKRICCAALHTSQVMLLAGRSLESARSCTIQQIKFSDAVHPGTNIDLQDAQRLNIVFVPR
jgi:hypothetical protein